MSWVHKPLGDVLDQSGRHRAGDRELPVLSITMKHGLVDQADKFKKRVASSNTSNYRIAYKNELVVGFPIDEGVLGFQTKYPAGIVSPAYNVWSLKAEADCHIPYLERFLRSPQARSLYASRMQGAVARRRSLTKTDFLNLEVPYPPLDEQIRIAQLLSKLERLIAQRRQHLQQLDDLLKSVFLEMFGNPVRNEKGWNKRRFGDLLAEIESGKSPKCEARPASQDEWGVLKLGAVTKCSYDDRENKALPAKVLPSHRDEVRVGDLLFSRKNTYDLVAACVYVFATRPRLLMPDLIFRFVFRGDAAVNPIYVWKLLTAESQRKEIQSLAAGAAGSMPNISKTNLKEARLPLPPLPLQDRFAVIVEKVEGIKFRYLRSLTDLEALYGALSQQAFKGELDLSRVPLPDLPIAGETPVASTPSSAQAAVPAINLPETELLLPVLKDREQLKPLLDHWLEAYLAQLGGNDLSVKAFFAAAESRVAELHPDDEFELGADAYDLIKAWVFKALGSGALEQVYPDENIRVALRRPNLAAEG
jgi:type I restriction enzyme S subunit